MKIQAAKGAGGHQAGRPPGRLAGHPGYGPLRGATGWSSRSFGAALQGLQGLQRLQGEEAVEGDPAACELSGSCHAVRLAVRLVSRGWNLAGLA